MIDEVRFSLENQWALRDCENRYLSDEDHYDDDSEEDYPYDTSEEAYG